MVPSPHAPGRGAVVVCAAAGVRGLGIVRGPVAAIAIVAYVLVATGFLVRIRELLVLDTWWDHAKAYLASIAWPLLVLYSLGRILGSL
jgi:hypothetical protein